MQGRMKSGSEGWIRVSILDYSDVMARTPRGVLTRGLETYKVKFEEGKHKGEVKDVPANYVEIINQEVTSQSNRLIVRDNRVLSATHEKKSRPLCSNFTMRPRK